MTETGVLRRGRWSLAVALALVVAGCALSTSIRISPHRVVHLRRTVLSTFDLDQLLGEMLQPELIRFLESQPSEFRNEPRVLAALGRAQSAARLYDDARRTLAEAREAFGTGSGRAGEAGWIESQTAFQQGDAPAALAAARAADEHMFRVPEGWMKYLEALAARAALQPDRGNRGPDLLPLRQPASPPDPGPDRGARGRRGRRHRRGAHPRLREGRRRARHRAVPGL